MLMCTGRARWNSSGGQWPLFHQELSRAYLSTHPLPKRGGVMIYEEGECETLRLPVAQQLPGEAGVPLETKRSRERNWQEDAHPSSNPRSSRLNTQMYVCPKSWALFWEEHVPSVSAGTRGWLFSLCML